MTNLQKHSSPNPIQRWLIARFQRRVAHLVRGVSPRRVLDAGCGEGFGLRHLEARLGSEIRYVGLDCTPGALAEAVARGTRSPLILGDLAALPWPADAFDLVLASEVLEHLAEPEQALDELCRVSARYVLLSVPWEPFFSGLNLLRGKNVSRLGSDEDHLQHWTRAGFLGRVRRRLRILAAPMDTFPWTLVLGELRRH